MKNYTETHLSSQGLILCMIPGIIRWVCSNSCIIKELLLDNKVRIMYFACSVAYSHNDKETAMSKQGYWADNYIRNKRSALDAIKLIKPGQRVFIGYSCGEPQYLIRTLSEASNRLTDIEIVRLLAL